MKMKKPKPVTKIGAEREDFEVDVVVVKIYKTRKERLIETAWTVTATILAVTISQVYIIPMLIP